MARRRLRGGAQERLGQASSFQEEALFQLETQLSQVIEQEGMVVSTSMLDESRMSKRAKRGIRRRVKLVSSPLVKTRLILEQSTEVFSHPVTALDKALVEHIFRASSPSLAARASSTVPVRYSTHAPSDHVLSLQLPARPFVEMARDPFGHTIQDWVAPYQIPPSIEGFAGAMQDLWLEKVDPRLFFEQFTPGQAHVAYRERYSWLSKLLKPFIVWEAISSRSVSPSLVLEPSKEASSPPMLFASSDDLISVEDSQPVFSMPSEQVPALDSASAISCSVLEGEESSLDMGEQVALHDEAQAFLSAQFTSNDIEAAYKASYGPWARFKRLGRKFLSIFDRRAHEVEEEAVKLVEKVEEEAHEFVATAEETWQVPVLVPRVHVLRVMAGFFGLLLIVTIPAGAVSLSRSFGSSVNEVQGQSKAALSEIASALEGSGGEQDAAWSTASERFGRAREALLHINALALGLAKALPQTRTQYVSAQALLLAGERTTQAAQLLTRGLARALNDQSSLQPDERLGVFLTYLEYASPLLQEALDALERVDPDSLPVEVRDRVASLRNLVGEGRTSLQDAQTLLTFLRSVLGKDSARTYLFVFQNSSELRPTGGFMGSVAEVVFDRGMIQSIHVPGGGPYDLRGQLKERVIPPRPLQLVGGRWEFQDANWFPDFAASAQKIRWFWSRGGQPTLDGVIAINSSVLERILRITGPIEMPEYGKVLTADNVIFELQKSVELEYNKEENKPKKIIGDLFPKVLERLKAGSREDWLKLVDEGLLALEVKDVQAWMARAEEQELVKRYDWSGTLKPTIGDALAIVEANIAGQKTDASIRERVDHDVSIDEDGSIIDTVTLMRRHEAIQGELFRGARNVSYVRAYVPLGSELLDAHGFEAPPSHLFETPLPEDRPDPQESQWVSAVSSTVEGVDVTQEFGRTAFGGWLQLGPGETRTTIFRYKLPFTVFDIAERAHERPTEIGSSSARAAYMLLLTSQSGKTDREIHTRVSFPQAWQMYWHTPSATLEQNFLSLQGSWSRDQIIAGLLDAK